MEAILAQGFRGMGEWMGIGRAGTGSTDIVAVIACHAIKSWRVHWSILHCCTKILQWTLHDLIAWRTTATILMLPLCSLHYYCCRLYVLRFVATLQFVSTLRFLSTINVSTLRFTVRSMLQCVIIQALGITVQRWVVQPEPPAPPPFIDYYKIITGY